MKADTFELYTYKVMIDVCGVPFFVIDEDGTCSRDESQAMICNWVYAQKFRSIFKDFAVSYIGANNDEAIHYAEDGSLIAEVA